MRSQTNYCVTQNICYNLHKEISGLYDEMLLGRCGMASVSSFRDVIANMYYNDLFDELSEYIEDNPDKLESNSYRVQSPDEAVLSDFDIITIDITDSPGNSIFLT